MSILEPESSIWYTICWIVLLARLLSRRIQKGVWKNLEVDDYLICVAMCTATVVMATMHVIIHNSSNLIAPGEDVSHFSQEEIESRVAGSKLVLVTEQMQIITIWLVKTCILLMYWRMTALLRQQNFVLAVAAYVAIGFVIMEVLYLGVWCRPFNQYWAVPPKSSQCSAATNHLITNAVINITSDLMIMCIPMPLLFKVKLPAKNKLILLCIFLIGTFSIIAAALNKYYSFTNPFSTEWTIWYLRESYTAILCANLPLTYPLVQRLFKLRNWSNNSYSGNYLSGSRPQRNVRSGPRSQRKSIIGMKGGLSRSGISKTVDISVENMRGGDLHRSESEERINRSVSGRIFDGAESQRELWVPNAVELGELNFTNERIEGIADSLGTKGQVIEGDQKMKTIWI